MAKSLLKIKARKSRRKGESVIQIAQKLGISKSTVSLWVRDIILSVDQLQKLKNNSLKGAELGRAHGAFIQKARRLQTIEKFKKEGIEELKKLKDKEFFVAGLALYWGEGSKKSRNVRLCNSDPELVNFMIKWLINTFDINSQEMALTVGINESHRLREEKVKEYWAQVTGLPLSQFRKTSFKKVKAEKIYENFYGHYGTLTVDVLKPARFYYKILGLIEGLSEAGKKLVFRGVS